MYRITHKGVPVSPPMSRTEAENLLKDMEFVVKGLEITKEGTEPSINQKPLEQDQRESIGRLLAEARKMKVEEEEEE